MSNNIIFNLTVKIEKQVEQEWLEDVKQNYFPLLVDGKIILSAQINKLILDQKEEENTFAIQFIYLSETIFGIEKLKTMEKFLTAMDKKYAGKYVYFATKMELIHFHNTLSPNPEISLN